MTDLVVPLLVAVGAGTGAALRHRVASLLDVVDGPAGGWPWGTFGVNVVGSGLVGGLTALALADRPWALLATGLCGGLTTWSGLAVQVHDLGWRRGTAYVVSTVLLGLAACAGAHATVAAVVGPQA